MYPESTILLGNEGVDEMAGDFVVSLEPAVGAVEVADFLTVGIPQNLAVAIVNLGSGRHFHHFIEIVSTGQGEVDQRDDQCENHTDKGTGQGQAGGPLGPWREFSRQAPNEPKRRQQNAKNIAGKSRGAFRGCFFRRFFAGLLAGGHDLSEGLTFPAEKSKV